MSYLIKTSGATVTIGTQVFDTTFIRLVNITCLQSVHFGTLMEKSGDGTFIIENNGVAQIATEVMGNLINLVQGRSSTFSDLSQEYIAPLRPSTSDNINDVISAMTNNQQLDLTEGDYVISSPIILPTDKDIIINLPFGNSVGYGSWANAKSANNYIIYQGDSSALRQYRIVGEGEIKYGRYGLRSKSSAYFGIDGPKFKYCGWNGQGLSTINAEAGGVLGYDSSQADLQAFWDGGAGPNVLNGGAARIEKSVNVLHTRSSSTENLRGFRYQDCGIGGKGLIFDVNSSTNIESGLYLASSSYTSSAGCENFIINNYVSNYNSNNGVLVIGGQNNTIGVGEAYGNWSAGCYFWYPTDNTWQVGKLYNNGRSAYNGIGNNADALSNLYVYFDAANLRANQKFFVKVAEADLQDTGLGTNIEKVAMKIAHTETVDTAHYDKNIIQFSNSELNNQDIGIDLYDCDCTMAQVIISSNTFTNNSDLNIKMPQSGTPIINPTNNFTTLKKLDIKLDSSKSQILLSEGPNGMPLSPTGINTIAAVGDGTGIKITEVDQKISVHHTIPLSGITLDGVAVNSIQSVALSNINSLFTNTVAFDASGSGVIQTFSFDPATGIVSIIDGGNVEKTINITNLDVSTDAQVVSGVQSGEDIVLTLSDGSTVTVNTADFLNQNAESVQYGGLAWYIVATGNGEVAGTEVTHNTVGNNFKDNMPLILGNVLKRNQEFIFTPPTTGTYTLGVPKNPNTGNREAHQCQGDIFWDVSWSLGGINGVPTIRTQNSSLTYYSSGSDIDSRFPSGYLYTDRTLAFSLGTDGYIRLYDVSNNTRTLIAESTAQFGTSVNLSIAITNGSAIWEGSILDANWRITNEYRNQGDLYESGLDDRNAVTHRTLLKQGKKVDFQLPFGNQPLYFGFGFAEQSTPVGSPNLSQFWTVGNLQWSNIEALSNAAGSGNFTFNTSNSKWNSTDNRWESGNLTQDTLLYADYKTDNKIYLYETESDELIGSWDQATTGEDINFSVALFNGYPTLPYGNFPTLLFSQIPEVYTSTPFDKAYYIENTSQFAYRVQNAEANNPMFKSNMQTAGRPWTWAMTFKFGSQGYFFAQSNGARSTQNGLRLFRFNNGNVFMFSGATSIGELSLGYANMITANEWTRIVITYDGSALNSGNLATNAGAYKVYKYNYANDSVVELSAFSTTSNTSPDLTGGIEGIMTLGTDYDTNANGYSNTLGYYANLSIINQALTSTNDLRSFLVDPIQYCSTNSITDATQNKIYLLGDQNVDNIAEFRNYLDPTNEDDELATTNAIGTSIANVDINS